MADQPKKPRNIKDLKARLGRTISPGGAGAGPVRPPGAQPGGVVPPPSVGGPVAPSGGGVAPPPFMQPKQKAKPKAADPFAAAATKAPAQQEVRLVIDEKPVDDREVGRKQRARNYLLIAAGLVVGLAVGLGAGSVNSERRLWNFAVEDGKAIYTEVRTASDVVNKAKRFVDEAVRKASGSGQKAPTVDYQAIEKLAALEKPFNAHQFSQRRYKAFSPGAVDALFEYFGNVNLLWGKFESLNAFTAGEDRRSQLDHACETVGTVATEQTGCVPDVQEGQMFCVLAYVHPPDEPPPEGEAPHVTVSSSLTDRRRIEKTIYFDQDMTEDPGQYVILTDTRRSVGVLGQQASLCAEYQRDIIGIKTLMDSTVEVQGRLEQELGNVARLDTVFAF